MFVVIQKINQKAGSQLLVYRYLRNTFDRRGIFSTVSRTRNNMYKAYNQQCPQ